MQQEAERVLDRAARRVREVYIEERQAVENFRLGAAAGTYRPGIKWDGGVDRQGKVHKPCWRSIARLLLDRGLDPETYVRQAFRLGAKTSKTPMPNQLVSQWLLGLFEKWWPHYVRELGVAFQFQQSFARAELTTYMEYPNATRADCWQSLLLDRHSPMTALFRYCLAVSEKFPKIAAEYRDAALREYLSSPREFDQVWKDWLPAELTTEARQLRAEIQRKESEDG